MLRIKAQIVSFIYLLHIFVVSYQAAQARIL